MSSSTSRPTPSFDSHGKPIDLFLYHDKCPDGLGAAAVAQRKLGARAVYIGCKHHEPPPEVAGKHVLVADFCFSKDVTQELKKAAASYLVLDHHKSAMTELGDDPNCYFDMNRSGAGLAWDFFFPGAPRPAMIDFIQDRDIWTWKLERSQEFAAALDAVPMELEAYSSLLEATISQPEALAKHLTTGTAMVTYRDSLVKQIAEKAGARMWLGHKILSVNSPILQSEVGNFLAKKPDCDIGLVWNYDHEDHTCRVSLRTFHEKAPDVSAIAKRYGGGGHTRASGMKWPKDTIETLFESNL
jgi:oligoribonuclease NrnB/cAMP/cGMP phosphodiesterase (DHH superfamily)